MPNSTMVNSFSTFLLFFPLFQFYSDLFIFYFAMKSNHVSGCVAFKNAFLFDNNNNDKLVGRNPNKRERLSESL